MAYLGMKATKFFNFQYTCEHCGKTVKKMSSVASEAGFNAIPPPGAKSVKINADGRQIYGRAATEHLIKKNCPAIESAWEKAVIPKMSAKRANVRFARNTNIGALIMTSRLGDMEPRKNFSLLTPQEALHFIFL
jgi:hypothetical protein